jgi:hypothetical protein
LPSQDAIFFVPAGSDNRADLGRSQSLLECLKDVPEPRRRVRTIFGEGTSQRAIARDLRIDRRKYATFSTAVGR